MSDLGATCWEWVGSEEGDGLTLKHPVKTSVFESDLNRTHSATQTTAEATLARGWPTILLATYYISAICKSPRDPVLTLEMNEFPTSHLKIKKAEQNQWFPTFLLNLLEPLHGSSAHPTDRWGTFLTEAVVCVSGWIGRAGERMGALPTLGFSFAPWWL